MSYPHTFVTTLALYGFPYALAAAFGGGGPWWVLLAADVLVLAGVSIILWSPIAVLVGAVVSTVSAVIVFLGTNATGACGSATPAVAVEAGGGVLLAVAYGTWGVRQGPGGLWAIPIGWIALGAWIIVWSHVIPGGIGPCSE